jgi:hypothetical protein
VNDTERVLELLRRAVAILEDEIEERPAKPLTIQPSDDEVLLEGVVGKCTLRQVGEGAIPVYNGSMKVRTPEGQERWVELTAWRKVALWAEKNLAEGEVVQAVGRWETNHYNGEDRPYFSVRLFSSA